MVASPLRDIARTKRGALGDAGIAASRTGFAAVLVLRGGHRDLRADRVVVVDMELMPDSRQREALPDVGPMSQQMMYLHFLYAEHLQEGAESGAVARIEQHRERIES